MKVPKLDIFSVSKVYGYCNKIVFNDNGGKFILHKSSMYLFTLMTELLAQMLTVNFMRILRSF